VPVSDECLTVLCIHLLALEMEIAFRKYSRMHPLPSASRLSVGPNKWLGDYFQVLAKKVSWHRQCKVWTGSKGSKAQPLSRNRSSTPRHFPDPFEVEVKMSEKECVEAPPDRPRPDHESQSADENLHDPPVDGDDTNSVESIVDPAEDSSTQKDIRAASATEEDSIKKALAQRKTRETLHDEAVGKIKELCRVGIISQTAADPLLEDMNRVRSIDVRTDVQAPKRGQYQVCSRVDNMLKIIGNKLSTNMLDIAYYQDWLKRFTDVFASNLNWSKDDVLKATTEVSKSITPRMLKCDAMKDRYLEQAYKDMFEDNSRRRSFIPFLWKEGIRTMADMPHDPLRWYQMSVAYNGWLFDRQRQGVEDQRANMVKLAANDEDRARLQKMVEEANRLDVEIFGTISRAYVSHTPTVDPEEYARYEQMKIEKRKERAKKRTVGKEVTDGDVAQMVGARQNDDDNHNNTVTNTTTETIHEESDDCGPPAKRQCGA